MVRARRQVQTERTRATRARVVGAATELFVRDGYLETTMSGVAKAAGVAVQTLYLAFGSKAAVLEASLAAAAGPEPAGGPAGRVPTDGPSALADYVRSAAAAIEREYPLAAVLRAAAADPDPAELLARARADALVRHARAIDRLAEHPGFADHLSLQRATDIVAVLLSPEAYGQLVVEHGWAPQDWTDWVTGHLRTDLFPQAG